MGWYVTIDGSGDITLLKDDSKFQEDETTFSRFAIFFFVLKVSVRIAGSKIIILILKICVLFKHWSVFWGCHLDKADNTGLNFRKITFKVGIIRHFPNGMV